MAIWPELALGSSGCGGLYLYTIKLSGKVERQYGRQL